MVERRWEARQAGGAVVGESARPARPAQLRRLGEVLPLVLARYESLWAERPEAGAEAEAGEWTDGQRAAERRESVGCWC